MPKVSVVIPVYNHEKFIAKAIDSVLNQTFRDFDLIVVDDGSTDRTPTILRSYGERIALITQPNAGGAAALNRGIRESRGEWIAWLSSDDEWEPAKLERQLEAVAKQPEVDMIFTDYYVIDADGRTMGVVRNVLPKSRWRQRVEILRSCFVNGSTVLIRRRVFDEIGLFDTSDRWAPDYEMWIRIVDRYRVARLAEPLVRYREHFGQASTVRRERVALAGHVVFSKVMRSHPYHLVAPAFLLRVFDALRMTGRRAAKARRPSEVRARLRMFVTSLEVMVDPERIARE